MAEQAKNPEKRTEKHAKPAEAPKQAKSEPPRRETQIIRFVETNLDGNKNVSEAIRRIDGLSFMLSNAITKQCGLLGKKLGQLSETEMKTLEEAILNPESVGVPQWMFNRRKEPLTGRDRHLSASQLDFAHKMDINELKKMKCYRGVRHIQGQPVRGQRTRSSFRKGSSVGVRKKKEVPAAAKK
ncbi:MAG TPA: 30S ribosomal protein S13 [archaeon]|nr:30S ribosomal protein S13 [archaeon]